MDKDELKKLISGEVLNDPETLQKYSKDASIFHIKPQVVVLPKSVEDVKVIVKFVNKNKGLSITCRAAGTDMTGGAINDSIILDTKYLDKVLTVGEDFAITQPGIYYRDFEAATLKQNLIMPTYPASREICTVGGMVSTNAGGELNLAYGPLERYVMQLKVVLADGNEYLVKPLTKDQLDKKIKQDDFEGQIYAKVYQLISQNTGIIEHGRPKVSKNSTGYLIWDVWNGTTFDLVKLFIGSQGTLGIITEITFKLVKPNTHQVLLVINLSDLDQLDQIVNTVLQFQPESFECFDKETYKLANKFSSELLKDFKHNNKLMAMLRFLPEKWMAITNSFPQLLLMANFTGSFIEEVVKKAKSTRDSLKQFKLKTSIHNSLSSAEKYWIIRHKSFGLLRFHSENGQASSFIDDIIVKPQFLPQFLPKFDALISSYKNKMVYTMAGHIGDGNFHVIPLMDLSKPEVKKIIPELMDKVFSLVFEYQGSMSAEHNDGLIRGPYLQRMYGDKIFNIFKQVKDIFDLDNIFNPHKKTDAAMEYTLKQIST